MKKTGFTLIELLVVIAIIGLISSIVLASLQSSRAKAYDASIKETMHQVRTAIALHQSTTGGYGTGKATRAACSTFGSAVFQTNSEVDTLIKNIDVANGSALVYCTLVPEIPSSSWTVDSVLRSDPTVTWCIDSNGYAGVGVGTIGNGIATRCQ